IAQVNEAGTHHGEGADPSSGVPYFVMEYIPNALALTEFAKQKNALIRGRLELFLQVCDAVHYGHQKGIIHRDLKPSNILVNASGQVKIIDFGVARATDSDMALTTLQTDVGQLLGTVQYMSPEQCRADPARLDIRSDVYALGVVLYEMLCEELPYDVRRIAVFEATRLICEKEPKRPSTTHMALRGDMETILLKALEKEPSRRYQSVGELAEDINRYLRGETIAAKPAGPATRTWKRIRRNPVVSTSIGLASAVILGALLYVVFFAYPQVIAERNKAIEARNEADLQREAALTAMSETEMEATRTRTVNRFLKDMLSLPDPGQEGRDVKVAEALDKAVSKIDEEFAGMPEINASLRATIGWTYYGLGQYAEAEALLRRAVELARDTLGETHPDTLDYEKSLSNVLRQLGRFAEAEEMIRKVYEIRRRDLGETHRLTLNAKSLLAEALHMQSRWAEAEPLIREAYADQVRTLGETHKDTTSSMDTFSSVLLAQGMCEEAEALNRKALEIRRKELGEDHPDTLGALSNLAVAIVRQGRFAEAEKLNRMILEERRKILGEEHPLTLSSLFNVANVLRRQGKLLEAEPLFREVVEIRRRVLGENHYETLRSMGSLALTLREMGNPAGAEAILRKVLDGFRATLGDEHVDTLTTMDALAIALHAQGKDSEAKAL
ncbi:MAG: tetratricopeptide repeat protein, partial [Planctomycetota bacterium]